MDRPPVALLLASLLAGAGAASAAPDEPPLGGRPAFDLSAAVERAWLAAGARLRREPHAGSPELLRLDADVELEVLARRGDWVQVRYAEWTGWVAERGERDAAAAEPSPAELAARRARDQDHLAAALRHLAGERRALAFGPFAVHTDSTDAPRLERLGAVAARLPAAYGERFGVAPVAPPGALVLYQQEASYLAFAAETVAPPALGAEGHAVGGVAAFALGELDADSLAGVLVHELTHLLNRAAFRGTLPPWLEEGLANDLSSSRVGRDGALELGTWGGTTEVTYLVGGSGLVVERRGAVAGRRLLLEAWQRRQTLPLAQLLVLPWEAFVEPTGRPLRYAQSVELVRFLLDGGDPARAAGFRALLADAAAGRAPDPARLEQRLGVPVVELERDFGRWLTSRIVAGG